jgi:hypothetical protein
MGWAGVTEATMKARQLIHDAAYGPEKLKVLFQAFDAWSDIAGNFGKDPSSVEAARTKLANVILGLAKDAVTDATQIKNSALRIMALDYKNGLPQR